MSQPVFRLLLALTLAAGLLSLTNGIARADINLFVTVTDCVTGLPIVGAQIKIPTANLTYNSASQAVTNDKGVANVNPLRTEGAHQIEVSAVGYQSKTIQATFPAWTEQQVKVCLARPTPIPVLPAINFKAIPESIYRGACSVLDWFVENASDIFLDEEKKSGSWGSKEVCPTATTTHTLKAVNLDGVKTQSMTITVLGDPPQPEPNWATDDQLRATFKEPECTWWATKKRLDNKHPLPIVLGPYGKWDAKNWESNVRELKTWPADHNPKVGDVVAWSKDTWVRNEKKELVHIAKEGGHVAYVEEVMVDPDGHVLIKISESNGGGNGAKGNEQTIYVDNGAFFIH